MSDSEASDPEASDPEASLIQTKRIDGIVEQNEDFKAANGKIWRRQPEPLGKGGYSQVYLYENGGSQWAVKRIPNISGGGRTSSAELKNEKAALIKFSKEERFVDFIGWFECGNIEYFALEYIQLGNLEDNLRKRGEDGLPFLEEEIKRILIQILEGVEFMHAEGYIHRDLKPENVLVAHEGPEWQVKITDLGLSKYTLGVREGYSFTGTPQYMAPEIYGSFLRPSDYTDAIDIWAIGCIACRMLIGKPPFSDPWLLVQYIKAIRESKSMDQLCKEVPYISKDLARRLDTKTSKGLFLRQLLEPKPQKRLNASRAKGHAWLQDFRTLQGHGLRVQRVAFSPNSKLLAWASSDRTVRLWSAEECKSKHIFESPEHGVFITFLRDSALVVCENFTGLVRVLNTATGEVKNEMKLPTYTGLKCSSDGSLVAATLGDSSIGLWDTEKGEIKYVLPRAWKDTVYGIDVSSNGEVMAVAHSDGCTIFRITGKEIQERMVSNDPWEASHVYFSPNDQIMALANKKGIFFGDEARFWDKHGQASKHISGPSFARSSRIGFSRDGKLAASATHDFEIRLDNTGKGEEMRVLKGHSNLVTSVAFSPISPLLASASWDHTVILWDTEKGEKLCTLKAHPDGIKNVTFSPNGEFVATVSFDGIVGLWNVSRWKNGKDQEQSS